jgi:hypothetical protein
MMERARLEVSAAGELLSLLKDKEENVSFERRMSTLVVDGASQRPEDRTTMDRAVPNVHG